MSELSQNLKAVLQDVGEGAVLIQLAILLREFPDWTIYKNFAEAGCDIVIQRTTQRHAGVRSIFIEVKTRQGLLTKRRQRNTMQFSVTENERNACDFVVCYWFERNAYFVVPRENLTRTQANGNILYKFIAYWSDQQQRFTDGSDAFRDKWSLILERIKH